MRTTVDLPPGIAVEPVGSTTALAIDEVTGFTLARIGRVITADDVTDALDDQ